MKIQIVGIESINSITSHDLLDAAKKEWEKTKPTIKQGGLKGIAICIDAYKAGKSFRSSTTWVLLSSVATLAWMAILLLAEKSWSWAAPKIKYQVSIQINDLKNFHAAVRNPITQDFQRQDKLVEWFDQWEWSLDKEKEVG